MFLGQWEKLEWSKISGLDDSVLSEDNKEDSFGNKQELTGAS